jgi:hypothetical protein
MAAPGHRGTLGTPDHPLPWGCPIPEAKTVWLPFVENFRISPGAAAFSSATRTDKLWSAVHWAGETTELELDAAWSLFPALPREKRSKGCMARIVPDHSAFRKRNDSRVTLSSSRGAVNFSSARTTKRFPAPQCASAIWIGRLPRFSYRQFESCGVVFARKSTNRTPKHSALA